MIGIYERNWWNFRLVRLDRVVQVSTTWQLEEELIMPTCAFIEKRKPTFSG